MTHITTETFVVGSSGSVLGIFEPIQGPLKKEPRYIARFEDQDAFNHLDISRKDGRITATSKHEPLVMWGALCDSTPSDEWLCLIRRARSWKFSSSRLLIGSKAQVKVEPFNASGPYVKNEHALGLIAAWIIDDKPSQAAVDAVENWIEERKAGFHYDKPE